MAKISFNIDDKLLEGLKKQASKNQLDLDDYIKPFLDNEAKATNITVLVEVLNSLKRNNLMEMLRIL